MEIYENLKRIAKILQEAGKIELYSQLLDVMKQCLDLQEDNRKIKAENDNLVELLKIKDELIYKQNAYWKKNDNDGPFCTRCWDKHKDLIRMVNDRNIYFNCPECKNSYNGPDYESYMSSPEPEWNPYAD
jgi:hypothetical protein